MAILRTLLGACALVLQLACLPSAWAQVPGVLRVSAIPDESPTELQRKFRPLGEYLKKRPGEVLFIPVTDCTYRAWPHADLAWPPASPRALSHNGGVPIVQRADAYSPAASSSRSSTAQPPT
jgi:phosphonate transport system substrate-binding protein